MLALCPPWPFLPVPEYTPQKGIVFMELGRGPRKITIDLVLDSPRQTPLTSRWMLGGPGVLGEPPLPPSKEMWLNLKQRT